jgi:hypothetical protein
MVELALVAIACQPGVAMRLLNQRQTIASSQPTYTNVTVSRSTFHFALPNYSSANIEQESKVLILVCGCPQHVSKPIIGL